jgi:hypothetical protein
MRAGERPSSRSAAQGNGTSPDGERPGAQHPVQRTRRRSVWIFLAVIGCGLLSLALALLATSGDDQQPTAPQAFVSIYSFVPLNGLYYTVNRLSASTFLLNISMQTFNRTSSSDSFLTLQVILPPGWKFGSCSSAAADCVGRPAYTVNPDGTPGMSATWQLNFVASQGSSSVEVQVPVFGRNFGYDVSSSEESVALPSVYADQPSANFPLNVTYQNIPTAQRYDWSSFPPSVETDSYSEWTEEVAGEYQSPRIAVGIDHGAQEQQNNHIFLAGAAVGVGGGALIGALQEALHLWADTSEGSKRRRRSSKDSKRYATGK